MKRWAALGLSLGVGSLMYVCANARGTAPAAEDGQAHNLPAPSGFAPPADAQAPSPPARRHRSPTQSAKAREAQVPAAGPWLAPHVSQGSDTPPPRDDESEQEGPDPTEEVRKRWAAEPEDPAWTGETTEYLASALRDLKVDGELLETSCRATLCKVELHFDSVDEAVRFRAAASKEQDATLRLEADETGLTAELYMPRGPSQP